MKEDEASSGKPLGEHVGSSTIISDLRVDVREESINFTDRRGDLPRCSVVGNQLCISALCVCFTAFSDFHHAPVAAGSGLIIRRRPVAASSS